MDYSRKISERQWNLPDKGELESRREETYIDDIDGNLIPKSSITPPSKENDLNIPEEEVEFIIDE